ncbi:MAG: hypothetical protein IPL45_00325 [Actinomycetales bacterium]|nr:hypothetical protein [Actinomycetales bacterium]
MAGDYRSTGEHIESAATNLGRLASPSTCSEAVEKILTESHDLADQLLKVSGRYSETAGALASYAPQLRAAQALADQAIAKAGEADKRRRQAADHATNLWWGWRTSINAEDAAEFERDYHQQKAASENAAGDVAGAKVLLLQAIEKRDAAGDAAARRISSAVDASPVNDTILDQFKELLDKGVDLLAKVGKWIWDNIDTIALVLTIAAAVTAFIPGVNAITPFLLAASKVAAMVAKVKAVVTTLQAVSEGLKTGNWSKMVGIGVGYLLGKVGGVVAKKLGQSAKTLLGQAIKKHNLKLTSESQGHLRAMYDKVILNGVADTDITRRFTNGTPIPGYRTEVQDALSALAHSKNSAINNDHTLRTVQALAGVMKGSDYSIIQSDMSKLVSFSDQSTISGDVARELKSVVGDQVEGYAKALFELGADQVGEAVGRMGQDDTSSLRTHRVVRQQCSVGAP